MIYRADAVHSFIIASIIWIILRSYLVDCSHPTAGVSWV
jgi:hypothetical protein